MQQPAKIACNLTVTRLDYFGLIHLLQEAEGIASMTLDTRITLFNTI
jgi:hypothetical protein